jgi:hypothetical protein
MQNNYQVDMSSIHGFLSSCTFIAIAHVAEMIGNIDLQTTSYIIAIMVGVDTLTGNPIKNSFISFWKKINGK